MFYNFTVSFDTLFIYLFIFVYCILEYIYPPSSLIVPIVLLTLFFRKLKKISALSTLIFLFIIIYTLFKLYLLESLNLELIMYNLRFIIYILIFYFLYNYNVCDKHKIIIAQSLIFVILIVGLFQLLLSHIGILPLQEIAPTGISSSANITSSISLICYIAIYKITRKLNILNYSSFIVILIIYKSFALFLCLFLFILYINRINFKSISTILVFLFPIIIYFTQTRVIPLIEKLQSFDFTLLYYSDGVGLGSGIWRLWAWLGYFNIFDGFYDHIFGFGISSSSKFSPLFIGTSIIQDSHNSFLNLYIEHGLFMFLFITIIFLNNRNNYFFIFLICFNIFFGNALNSELFVLVFCLLSWNNRYHFLRGNSFENCAKIYCRRQFLCH